MKKVNIGKQIIFLERKKELVTNDLFKLVSFDLLNIALGDLLGSNIDKSFTNECIDKLEEIYKDTLHELRNAEKVKSRQITIDDEMHDSNK